MRKFILIVFCIVQTSLYGLKTTYQAVVIVPIADLTGQSLQEKNPNSVISTYKNLSICGKKGEFACPRVHQALFHEWVTVLEEHGDEVMVKIPNFFFETNKSTTKHDTFWSLKKNFLPLEHIEKHRLNRANLPSQISYEHKTPPKNAASIVTLLQPYKDPITHLTYSVGTRFVLHKFQQEHALLYALDHKNMRIYTLEVPKKIIACTDALTPYQKRTLFVKLCKQWAHNKQGCIPYVWGGCSIARLYKQEHFSTHDSTDQRGMPTSYYKRNDVRHPHSGVDCAGLVARAAQTAGLPYYYKNSTTLAKNLSPYSKSTTLQAGDLIWFSGHVMIIGNLEKNTIIEARHYSHDYGIVHEIPLKEVFKGINTFEHLKQAYVNNKPLLRMDKDQRVIQTINQFKLLQMSSVF